MACQEPLGLTGPRQPFETIRLYTAAAGGLDPGQPTSQEFNNSISKLHFSFNNFCLLLALRLQNLYFSKLRQLIKIVAFTYSVLQSGDFLIFRVFANNSISKSIFDFTFFRQLLKACSQHGLDHFYVFI